MNDWKRALRRLPARPGFALVVVITLALGIAANATVSCWMDQLVYRPLPGVPRQEELVVPVSSQGGGNVSQLDLADFAALTDVFAGAAYSQMTFASLDVGRQPEWVNTQVVSANFFDVLEVRPLLGRTFLADEDRKPDGNPVLVVSERLWRRRFAADPGIVGRVVELNRHPFTIVGVVPAPFRGSFSAQAFDVWAPSSMIWHVRNQRLDGRAARGWHPLARLRRGVSLERARAAVQVRNEQLARAYPETNRDVRHRLVSFADCPNGAQAVLGPALRLLQAVSLLVLLIVAVNVANLSLASASSRRKEIAIQLSLGASRGRIVRGLVAESLLLALAGGALGAVLASRATGALGLFLPATPMGVVLEFPLRAATLVFTLLLTLATGLLIGLLTAVRATALDVHAALKDGGRSGSGGHQRLRNALVVAEVALALVLLVGAGLCLQGLRRVRQVDLGLDPERVLTANLQIGMNGYTPQTGLGFYRELRRRLSEIPGVEDAALASWFPLGLAGCKGSGVAVEGYQPKPGDDRTYEFAIISARYLSMLRIPLVAGREFTDGDDMRAERVAIVNQAFAERFWPGQDALGRRFTTRGEWRLIVGVTRTGKYNRLDEPSWPFYYLPDQQGVPELDLSLAVRTKNADPVASAAAVEAVVRGLDPRVAVLRTLPLASHVQGVFFAQRMASGLLLVMGAVSLSLAALGVYGVMAYAVAQRTREFGIRAALGATRGDVLRLVLKQSLILSGIGVAIGLALSAGLGRLVASFLQGVSPFDAITYASVPLLMALVALLAGALPAHRATRVDPNVALRCD